MALPRDPAAAAIPADDVAQGDAGRRRLRLADDDEGEVDGLTPEEQASLAKSLEQAERGAFASDEEVRSVWAKHGL